MSQWETYNSYEFLSSDTGTQGNSYMLHNFDNPYLLSFGGTVPGATNIPYLHLHSVTLSVHTGDNSLPLKGVFNWHYLQCVLRRFGTHQYKHLPNITFFVYPFKTADDESDDEFEDDVNVEPPYPSYRFDRFMEQQLEKHREQERFKEVAQWASEVASEVEWGFVAGGAEGKYCSNSKLYNVL